MTAKPRTTTQAPVKVHEDTHRALRLASALLGLTQAELVRRALAAYLTDRAPDLATELDRAQDTLLTELPAPRNPYAGLATELSGDEVKLFLPQIELAIGHDLPLEASASHWWRNDPTAEQARVWLEAGYEAEPALHRSQIVFRRTAPRTG